MPNEQNGQAGDSLKVDVTDDGQITLDWDPNDPQWGWLSNCTDEQIQQFVTTAIETATKSTPEIEEDELNPTTDV